MQKIIAHNIVASGKSWISNYNTTKNDIDELVEELNDERQIASTTKIKYGG